MTSRSTYTLLVKDGGLFLYSFHDKDSIKEITRKYRIGCALLGDPGIVEPTESLRI